jgi:transcriptional regulator with XRE-family HTH domain
VDWRGLAREVDAERERQRLTWPALAKRAGISPRTLFDIRKGERTSYHPESLDRLESGLGWEHGSVERVLAGQAPRRKADPDLARLQNAWRDLSVDVRRTLADVAEHYLRQVGRPGGA